MEAKLFAIQCGINQAIYCPDVSCIIIITDALYMSKIIFNSLTHTYQIQVIAISKNLREFFNKLPNNTIEFWDCPGDKDWHLHVQVDRETKSFQLVS